VKTSNKFKPIHFSAQDVGLMIRVVAFFNPKYFEGAIGESEGEIEICSDLIGRGFQPSAAVMQSLNLRKAGKGYTWTLR
jgi:hypothetical protein